MPNNGVAVALPLAPGHLSKDEPPAAPAFAKATAGEPAPPSTSPVEASIGDALVAIADVSVRALHELTDLLIAVVARVSATMRAWAN